MLRILGLFSFLLLIACTSTKKVASDLDPFQKKVNKLTSQSGYFEWWWDEDSGKIWLAVDKIDSDFLYINYLSNGLGSNDIGMDRGQIGNNRLVQWKKVGNKLLLIQPNLNFRSSSSNAEEISSVEQAFAKSVLWGFEIVAKKNGKFLIDLTPFLVRDAHGVAGQLTNKKQGKYKLDKTRSGVMRNACFNFPKNSEFEALITFIGNNPGNYLRSVLPSNEAFTLQTHHSFVALPESPLVTRVFDPRAGYFPFSYFDYSAPIHQPIQKRFIIRHRLEKKNPEAVKSEAVEPIIYYLDRGTPEPVRTALLAGARWWNQAFEAAGYIDAFQVKMLPADAHPLDIRYNVIQWVHRSTRGWSYGSSVKDPRTGEILKGHVSLGSLRVRQDFMIAQGLIQAYKDNDAADPRLLEMALARLRQLSAHEVGHTLGLAHNFAASTDGRTSVMDYPYPYVQLDAAGNFKFDVAYEDAAIGAWDKQAIKYGYGTWVDEEKGLQAVIDENRKMELQFISDADARPAAGMHPSAHLWENGKNPAAELDRLLELRKKAMSQFGLGNIPNGTPLGTLEEIFAPLYLGHRYQVEAVSKLIGGVQYSYQVKGEGNEGQQAIGGARQREALNAILRVLEPAQLSIPAETLNLLLPKPLGFNRSRESFASKSGPAFDQLLAAQSLIDHALYFTLHPARLNRLLQQSAHDSQALAPQEVFTRFQELIFIKRKHTGIDLELNHLMASRYVHNLFSLFSSKESHPQIAALTLAHLQKIQSLCNVQDASQNYLMYTITQFLKDPSTFKSVPLQKMPDGSPIGSDLCPHIIDYPSN